MNNRIHSRNRLDDCNKIIPLKMVDRHFHSFPINDDMFTLHSSGEMQIEDRPSAFIGKNKYPGDISLPDKLHTDKRSHARMRDGEVCELFDIAKILVRISKGETAHVGYLYDISEGGIAVQLSTSFMERSVFRVTFLFGKIIISSKAVTRHLNKVGDQYVVGITFIDINNKYAEYIRTSICLITLLSNLNHDHMTIEM